MRINLLWVLYGIFQNLRIAFLQDMENLLGQFLQ